MNNCYLLSYNLRFSYVLDAFMNTAPGPQYTILQTRALWHSWKDLTMHKKSYFTDRKQFV